MLGSIQLLKQAYSYHWNIHCEHIHIGSSPEASIQITSSCTGKLHPKTTQGVVNAVSVSPLIYMFHYMSYAGVILLKYVFWCAWEIHCA